MDILSIAVLKDLCIRAGIRPSRAAGQNFLINEATRDRIIAAIDPKPGDTIVEVGAGFGVLTTVLTESGAHVMAIERDHRIVPILREITASYTNVDVVEADVLQWLRGHSAPVIARPRPKQSRPLLRRPAYSMAGIASVAPLPRNDSGRTWKLVANLPYSITSDFLRLLLDRIADGSLPTPDRVVLLLQREVVDRLTGRPDATGFLTIAVQFQCSPRRVIRVPPSHFWPVPKVESAVVVMDSWKSPEAIAAALGGVDRATFLSMVHTAFMGRRQQLGSRLRAMLGNDRLRVQAVCTEATVDATRRPETLTLPEWIAIARAMMTAR